jgi:glycosyltransferase involved in cell wall biosynthesis
MPRALLVQPSLQPPGGGNGVAAWMLQALRDEYELTVLAWRPVDLEEVNRFYGTTLRPADVRVILAPAALRWAVDAMPFPLGLLRTCVMLRLGRRLAPGYDLLLCANNESDFGRPGIQYIHFPWNFWPRPEVDFRWYHVSLGLVRAYHRLCHGIAGVSFDRIRQNVTLVNSDWTAGKVREAHGIESVTLHPPVAGDFPDLPWSEREDGFVCAGRFAPEKNLDAVIDIVAALRLRVPSVHLHLVGGRDSQPRYERRIRRRAAAHPDWIFLHQDVSRSELTRLFGQHRYGIHGMLEEHFGMAIAEMVRAGCIPFIPNGGGQVEIVGGDERLVYRDPTDAVEKAARVLVDPGLQHALRADLARQRDDFSAERFAARLREIVRRHRASLAHAQARPGTA